MKKLFVLGSVALLASVIGLFFGLRNPVTVDRAASDGESSVRRGAIPESAASVAEGRADADAAAAEATEPVADEASPEDDEEEKLVDAFDALTDKWLEPTAKGVTMEDVDAFVRRFAAVPKARKEECLHRALNLIPDENVMLLAGILMDKSQSTELVELVFNDVLNRDEEVKKPILRQIFQDKTHPCWADVAWILDVTGELR